MELLRDSWPKRLVDVRPKIKDLFYKGEIGLLADESPKLAVVGSRRMTDYGLAVVERWIPILVNRGVTIVSGFMYGVDQAAHRVCLENGGKTIAVLGWGIERQVCSEDVILYQKILEKNGLIVSEYGGETESSVWRFPQRNRIVVGIADAVLVVEAAERSGSLITANWALKMEKKLLAVPGAVFSAVSKGTNRLIADDKAETVVCAEDVLDKLGLKVGLKTDERKMPRDPLLFALGGGPRSADELARVLQMSVPKLLEKILQMELEGLVEEKNGKYFRVM